jgi:hypothetical protein
MLTRSGEINSPENAVPQDRKSAVAAAVRSIREFHRAGRSLPKKAPHKDAYDSGRMDAEAKRLGVNVDTARKARQFADAKSGYSKNEVDDLCRLISAVQTDQGDDRSVFTRTHLIRLLTVPKRWRAGLQATVIEKGWSVSELEAQIAARYGIRRAGGRKRRVPADVLGLLTQIERSCEAWRRWSAGLAPPLREGSPAKGAGARSASTEDLPEGIVKRMRSAEAAVAALHQAVADELSAHKPDMSVRHRFRSKGA